MDELIRHGSATSSKENDGAKSRQESLVTQSSNYSSSSSRREALNAKDFIQWQVSTESGLKEAEEQLKTNLQIAAKQAELIDKLRASNEAAILENKIINQDNAQLESRLEQLRNNINFLKSQTKTVKTNLTAFRKTKNHFVNSEISRDQVVADLGCQLDNLQLQYHTKLHKADQVIKAKTAIAQDLKKSVETNKNEGLAKLENLRSCYRYIQESIDIRDRQLKEVSDQKHKAEAEVAVLTRQLEDLAIIKKAQELQMARNEEKFLAEYEALKVQASQTSQEADKLKVKLSNLTHDNDDLSYKIETNKDEISDMDGLISDFDSKGKILSAKLTELSKKEEIDLAENVALTSKMDKVKVLKLEIQSRKDVLKNVEAKGVTLNEELAELNKIDVLKDSLNEENCQLSQEAHRLETEANSKLAEVQHLKDSLKIYDREIAEKSNQFNVMSKEVTNLSTELESLTTEESNLAEKEFILKRELNDTKEKLERAKMDNEDLREKNLKTKADILTIENEVSTNEAILKDKLINLNDAKFKVSDLESKISAVKMSIEEKKQILKTNEDLKKSDNDKEKEAKKKLKELNADIASKKKIASKQLQDVEVKSSKIESSKKEFIEAQERLIKLQSKVDQLKVVLAESEKQVDEMNQIEKENEINKTKETEIEAKIKAKKKEVTQLKRSLTSSTKNNDKLQKQLDKNTDSYNKVKTELDQLQKKYDENKMKQATLIKDIDDATSKIDEQAKANDANKDNQKLVENVLNEFKAEKAKILNEIENAEKEFKGILICKQRDNDEIYQKLQSELDLSAKELNSKTLEYEMKMAELAKLDVQPEDTSKVHKDIRHLEESIKALETHLVEKKAESKKLDGKLESLKETYCPTPSRFFRSPRALLSGSQAVPSPRKKFAASEPSPVRSKLAPPRAPRLSPRKSRILSSDKSPAKINDDFHVFSLSESSQ